MSQANRTKITRSISIHKDLAIEADKQAASLNRSFSNFVETLIRQEMEKEAQTQSTDQ